jgi:hypothetical protein
MKRDAVLSPCGTYRYSLTRQWKESGQLAGWIMLNPSTADANVDDPTIRRCISFSAAWGCSGLVVRNLFALRSTDPRGLAAHADPVGPDNDEHLRACADDQVTIVAWGTSGGQLTADRAEHVLAMLRAAGVEPICLGMTKNGAPRHPLYMPGAALPRPFPAPPVAADPTKAALFPTEASRA